MATTYSSNLGLPMPGTTDRHWDLVLNQQIATLDALDVLSGFAVTTTEHPSATLNVAVAAGSFRSGSGTVISYGGTGTGANALALTASATNSVYLSDTGVLKASTTGFPTFGNIVPIAIVLTGATTVTSITMMRSPWFARGGHAHWGVGTPTITAGPAAGASTTSVSGSDQAGMITVTTGTGPTALAVLATLTFGQTFSSTPRAVHLSPANAPAAALSGSSQVWPDAGGLSTTQFTLNVGGTALAASQTYKWFYAVIG
jgi:hypothetical protein